MNERQGFGWIRILVGIVLLGLVAAVAYSAGLAASGAGPGPGPGYYAPFFFGFGFFHLLFPLLFLGLILALVFRPRRHWGGWYGPGGMGTGYRGGPGGRDVPPWAEPMLEDWHKRAHGETSEPKNQSGTSGSGSGTPTS